MRKVYLIPLIIYPVLFAVIRGIEREAWGLKTILGGLFVALLCSGVRFTASHQTVAEHKEAAISRRRNLAFGWHDRIICACPLCIVEPVVLPQRGWLAVVVDDFVFSRP